MDLEDHPLKKGSRYSKTSKWDMLKDIRKPKPEDPRQPNMPFIYYVFNSERSPGLCQSGLEAST